MNKTIIDQFNQLIKQIQAEYFHAQIENDLKEMKHHEFRLKSIKKSLNIVKKLDFEITRPDDLKGIPGIGAGTLRRITEILEHGYLSELHHKYKPKKQKKITSIQELMQVFGIGDRLARKLVVEHGITSVDALKKAVKRNKIKVSDQVLMGLKYHGIVQRDIPREEIRQIEKYLKREAKKIDPELEIMICGSYRRGKAVAGDVDVMLYHPKVEYTNHIRNPDAYGLKPYLVLLINALEKKEFLLDAVAFTEMKYMGFCQYQNNPVRRIDIRYMPYHSIYTGMLYFTGPYELNEEMRRQAKKRGMILNEYGLYRVDAEGNRTLVPIRSEREVFEKLGMKYLSPEERETYSSGKFVVSRRDELVTQNHLQKDR